MMSPDILVGKKYAGYLYHCHNWRVGWQVLTACRTDRERASAYGYLSHLAADVVAHNYYVPYSFIKGFDMDLMSHTYAELRFDNHVTPKTWEEMKRIVKGDFGSFDRLLESTLKKPIFSFGTNKKIFNTILLVHQLKQVRTMVATYAKYSEWTLSRKELGHYQSLIMEVTEDFLTSLHKARCLQGEPNGEHRLQYALNMRKSLRKLLLRRLVRREEIDRFVTRLRGALQKTIFDPEAELPQSFEAL